MSNLNALQQAFQARLLNHDNSQLQNLVVKTRSPSAKQRINVYANGYKIRLIEALSSNYSQLSGYVGQKVFDKIAKTYLAQYPSNFRLIQSFGDKLASFLQEHYPQRPVLAELAKFEWAICHTIDAADQITLSIDDLRKIETSLWTDMKFNFHPSVKINDFAYNVITLWDGLLNQKIRKAAKFKDSKAIVFWRHNLKTFYRPMSKLESKAIALAINGKSFAQICEIFSISNDENTAATKAVTLLIKWINAGLICRISI